MLCFAAQSLHGLRFNFGLQCFDLNLLVGNLLLLLGDLLLETRGHRVLPFLLLALLERLVVQLDLLVAGITRVPDQTVRFGGRGRQHCGWKCLHASDSLVRPGSGAKGYEGSVLWMAGRTSVDAFSKP